jgi:DTW domain-containing protein YfiP
VLHAAPVKRLICTICQRPQSACICQWVTRVEHMVEVLILQHPIEVTQAKGSARLLHLCLPQSRLVTGEVFDGTALCHPAKQDILLYPDTPQDRASGVAIPPVLTPGLLDEPAQIRLVVIDGTWRKSRKMLYLNPWLQRLPRLPLSGLPPSNYLIRKAHKPDQLSTLEAVCAALGQLEGGADKYQPLLEAFDGFVAQQMAWGEAAKA